MQLFSGRARGRKFVLVDIGSASVGAAGILVLPEGRAVVVWAEREIIPIAERLEPTHFFSATLHALNALSVPRL